MIELEDRPDRRAPAPVRGLRRLPLALALGGPRPAALRGGRLRDAVDHQRLAADERGRPRRRQRDLRRLGPAGARPARASPPSTPTSTSSPRRSSASATPPSASGSPRARVELRDGERSWTAHGRRPRAAARRRLAMRVGVVTKWFNRGQPVVGRQLRSAVDELGHESFVLARPKKEKRPAARRARPRRRLGPARGHRGLGVRRARARSTSAGSTRTGSRPSSATRTTSSPSSPSCAAAASGRSAASSGSTSPPSTSTARARPSTSSTR